MKGYVVFTAIVAAILVLLPPLFLKDRVDRQTEETNGAVEQQTIYAEQFSVKHTDEDKITAVSAYDLTVYATAASMSPNAPVEAIKAQAIACYTSFCYQRLIKEGGKADVQSTPLPFPQAFCETYWQEQWGEAYETNIAIVKKAVDAVAGKTVQYNGRPIMALWHTMNAGQTENGQVLLGEEVPYLVSVASAADAASEQQLTTVTIPKEEAVTVLASLGIQAQGEETTWFSDSQKSAAGTVQTITVCQKQVTGYQIQQAFSLPSAAFEVATQEGTVIFTVRGSGHFVGMSCYGAIDMATHGKSCDEILTHYYKRTTVQ